tara:strand:+ start:6503 stop:6640 length:138 start_codon:yes stop_codon:yes gene_type:complete
MGKKRRALFNIRFKEKYAKKFEILRKSVLGDQKTNKEPSKEEKES